MAIGGILGKLWVELGLKDDLTPGLDKTQGKLGKIGSVAGKTLGGIAKVGKVAAASVLAGAGALAAVGIAELKEGEAVAAQTGAVLKSTGGAAGVTAEQIGNLSNEIMNMSGQSDEAIQAGQNMLLTFTDIKNEAGEGNDIFNQTTRIMADMSQAMGTDMKGQAIQLGKALNNPTKGVSALSKVGVTFTQQQKDQIKKMQEAGDMAGAQSVILKELQKEFGGSAKAAGETFGGQLAIAKGGLENLAGEVLSGVMPALKTLIPIIGGVLSRAIQAVKPVLDAIIMAFEQLLPVFLPIIDLVGEIVVSLVPFIKLGVELLKKVLTPLIPSLIELVKAFLPLLPPILKLAMVLLPPLAALLGLVATVVAKVLVKALGLLIPPITKVIGWITTFLSKLSGAKDSIKTMLGKISDVWKSVWGGMGDFFGGIWDGIKNTFKSAINFLIRGINIYIDGVNMAIKGMNIVNPFKDVPNIPHIPEFAKGGVMPGPIGMPGLAIVHGGERITPPGVRSSMQSSGGAISGDLVLQVDGQTFARISREHLLKMKRKTGTLGLA